MDEERWQFDSNCAGRSDSFRSAAACERVEASITANFREPALGAMTYRARRRFFSRDWRSLCGLRLGFEIANVALPTLRTVHPLPPCGDSGSIKAVLPPTFLPVRKSGINIIHAEKRLEGCRP